MELKAMRRHIRAQNEGKAWDTTPDDQIPTRLLDPEAQLFNLLRQTEEETARDPGRATSDDLRANVLANEARRQQHPRVLETRAIH